MTKIKKILAGSLALATTSIFAANTAIPHEMSSKELKLVKSEYKALVGAPYLSIIKGIDQGSFKQVSVEANTKRGSQTFEMFIPKSDKNVVFFGKAYDKSGKPYMLPLDTELIKKGVAFTVGNGKENIYLVTDPECPYCRKLESNLDPKISEKYTINVIPMPLSFHRDAKPMLYWILSAKTNKEKAERLHKTMTGDESFRKYSPSPAVKAEIDAIFAKSNKAAIELGAKGTPSVYDSNFNKIGYDKLVKKKNK